MADESLVAEALRAHLDSSTAHFDRLAAQSDPARIEPLDLIAMTALGAAAPVTASAWILGDLGQWLTTEKLSDIPTDVSLAAADASVIHRLADLYNLLRSDASLTRSATTRLLAAKRPSLVPVDDATTRRALSYTKTDSWWLLWREAMNDDVVSSVELARDAVAADIPQAATMSTMRIMDTVLRQSATKTTG